MFYPRPQAISVTAGDTRHHIITHARTTIGLACGACHHHWEEAVMDHTRSTCPMCGTVLPAFGLPQN